MGGQGPPGSQTLERALNVLLKIGEASARGLSLAECNNELGYSKATTHRILQTLTKLGFLRFEQERGVYQLGVRNLLLGMDFLHELDIRREAIPLLGQLAETTNETVHLGVLVGAQVVYIDKVESSQAVRMYSRVGHTMPAYSTGIGKAILAFLPLDQLQNALPRRLAARTAATITNRSELREHLEQIRERGYSTDDIENEEGIRCVGAPIFDHAGAVCAGISVAGPASRITPDKFDELGALTRVTAQHISERIGFLPERRKSERPSRVLRAVDGG
jgi:DNA-binding IclR family transcriptional regulator